jgi:hypothetical protein
MQSEGVRHVPTLGHRVAPPRHRSRRTCPASFKHAAALTGYGPGGFLVRCSWGEEWGDGGYAVATEAYLAEATVETYGVVV